MQRSRSLSSDMLLYELVASGEIIQLQRVLQSGICGANNINLNKVCMLLKMGTRRVSFIHATFTISYIPRYTSSAAIVQNRHHRNTTSASLTGAYMEYFMPILACNVHVAISYPHSY